MTRNQTNSDREPPRGAARLQTNPGVKIDGLRDPPSGPLREKPEPPTAACCRAASPSARETKMRRRRRFEQRPKNRDARLSLSAGGGGVTQERNHEHADGRALSGRKSTHNSKTEGAAAHVMRTRANEEPQQGFGKLAVAARTRRLVGKTQDRAVACFGTSCSKP
jgi:hypothetical protein